MYSDILLTVDFDRTLTDKNSEIPERNIEAIRYFMAHGGAFTLNTGRSVNTMGPLLHAIPTNAPFLLYNGSAAYDPKTRQLVQVKTIDLDIWQTMDEVPRAFPEMNLEIQGERVHYLYSVSQEYKDMYDNLGWHRTDAVPGMDVGPFMKFALFGPAHDNTVANFFSGTEEELARMDEAENWLRQRYGHVAEVYRAAPRILDVHAAGVSKGRCARELLANLGRKILVCVGDAENDRTMMNAADYAYCPSDGVISARYENVCPCGEGAVADVIYRKIPQILKNKP